MSTDYFDSQDLTEHFPAFAAVSLAATFDHKNNDSVLLVIINGSKTKNRIAL